jgi:WD40 repeat protein
MADAEKKNEIFVSYRRVDVEFTQNICRELEKNGFTVWIDWTDIQPGVENFSDEIQRGIEGANAFICILSPSYLESIYCLNELKEALRLKKRIIPIVLKKFEPAPAPEGIGHINWVYFTPHAGQENTFKDSFPKVLQAIQADYEHSREHTRLLLRALTWEKNDHGRGYLLKEAELEKAEKWQAAAGGKNPPPTELQGEFILASRKDTTRRARNTLIGVSIALIVSIVLGILALYLRQVARDNEAEAIRQSEIAKKNEEEAIHQSQIALARQLAAQAQSAGIGRNANQTISTLLATESMKIYPSNEAATILLNNNYAAIPVTSIHQAAGTTAFAVSPNGWYVATTVCNAADSAPTECAIHVWEAATGKEIINIPNAHAGWVNSIDLNGDGSSIVTGSEDGTACIWETATGRNIACMTHHDTVSIVTFSPNGNYVASVSGKEVDVKLHVWDAYTGNEIASISEDSNIRSIDFSPNSSLLLAGAWADVFVWEIGSDSPIALMTHYDESDQGEVIFTPDIASVAFSPDGKHVLSGSWDRTARVWDISTQTETARMTHDLRVTSVAFSPNGDLAVSGSEDGAIRVWKATDGEEVARMAHNGSVWSVTFSPDGKYILSQSQDNTARVWEVSTGKEAARMTHEGGVSTAAFSPDSKYVISTGGDETVRVWKIANSMVAARFPHNELVKTFAFSMDGKYIALGNNWGDIRVVEVASGKEIASMNDNSSQIKSVAFSPDGKYVVSGNDQKTATVWETSTGNKLFSVSHDDGEYWNNVIVTYTLDGKYILTAAGDNSIRTWDASTGKDVARKDFNDLGNIAFGTDGKYLVSGSFLDGTVRVLNTSSGAEEKRMSHGSSVYAVAFSPNGLYVASAGRLDNTVRVWEASTGSLVRSIIHASPVESIAFSPDSLYIASGENDRTAHIWEISTGKEMIQIKGESTISTIGFSDDGKHLVSSGCDKYFTKYCTEGSARLWTWQPDTLIHNACSVMLRNFTQAEWTQYIGDVKPYESICTDLPVDGEIATIKRDSPLVFEIPEPVQGTNTNNILFEDDFTDPTRWETFTNSDRSAEYDGETLRMQIFQKKFFDWSMPSEVFNDNIHTEVTITHNDSNVNTSFGIMCFLQPDQSSFYYAVMDPGGFYAIARATNNANDIFLSGNGSWATSNLIEQNKSSYRVGLDCGNGAITLYVDGTEIDSVSDSAYTNGDIGLVSWSGETASDVSFDDIIVTKID